MEELIEEAVADILKVPKDEIKVIEKASVKEQLVNMFIEEMQKENRTMNQEIAFDLGHGFEFIIKGNLELLRYPQRILERYTSKGSLEIFVNIKEE